MKRSIMIVDHLIQAHLRNAHGMRKLIAEWNSDAKSLGETIASVHIDVAKCLDVIKKQIILEAKYPNCKHPKKYLDLDGNNVIYCTQCNSDLTEDEIKLIKHPKLIKKYLENGSKVIE